jgi:cytochrome c553
MQTTSKETSMNLLRRLPAGFALLLACAAAVGDADASGDSAGADLQACLMCHQSDEFESLSVAQVLEVLTDPGIPPHRPFAGLTEAEVAALLESE